MKYVKFFSTACLILLVSCTSSKQKNTEAILFFIPGTYVRAFEDEFSVGNDTLVVKQANPDVNYYTIDYLSSYQRILEKQRRHTEYKREKWIALFNRTSNILVEQKKGKLIAFLPEQNELLLGASLFHKIK